MYEAFGSPRLRALVPEHGDEEEKSLGDFFMEEFYSYVGEGWKQEDDITLLTLKRSASQSRTSKNSVKRKFYFAEFTFHVLR